VKTFSLSVSAATFPKPTCNERHREGREGSGRESGEEERRYNKCMMMMFIE
jgi:hypothetical protein